VGDTEHLLAGKTDIWFQPGSASVGDLHTAPGDPGDIGTWVKMHDFVEKHGQSFDVFGASISMFDVAQGGFGACYFLATLAAVAQTHPAAIEAMFVDRHLWTDKVYTVLFYTHLGPTKVAVDDWVPTKYGGEQLFGSKFTKNRAGPLNLWPVILEKAYAKLFGSYGAIEGGQPSEIFYTMFGGLPITRFSPLLDEMALDLTNTDANELGKKCFVDPNDLTVKEDCLYYWGGHPAPATKGHRVLAVNGKRVATKAEYIGEVAAADAEGHPVTIVTDGGLSPKVWTALQEATTKKYPMATGTKTTAACASDSANNAIGLYCGHAYTIMEVGLSNGLQIVRLFNPHAADKYKGVLAHDPMYGNVDKSDGDFWMSYAEFLEYCNYAAIAAYSADYARTGQAIISHRRTFAYKFNVPSDEEFSVMFEWPLMRFVCDTIPCPSAPGETGCKQPHAGTISFNSASRVPEAMKGVPFPQNGELLGVAKLGSDGLPFGPVWAGYRNANAVFLTSSKATVTGGPGEYVAYVHVDFPNGDYITDLGLSVRTAAALPTISMEEWSGDLTELRGQLYDLSMQQGTSGDIAFYLFAEVGNGGRVLPIINGQQSCTAMICGERFHKKSFSTVAPMCDGPACALWRDRDTCCEESGRCDKTFNVISPMRLVQTPANTPAYCSEERCQNSEADQRTCYFEPPRCSSFIDGCPGPNPAAPGGWKLRSDSPMLFCNNKECSVGDISTCCERRCPPVGTRQGLDPEAFCNCDPNTQKTVTEILGGHSFDFCEDLPMGRCSSDDMKCPDGWFKKEDTCSGGDSEVAPALPDFTCGQIAKMAPQYCEHARVKPHCLEACGHCEFLECQTPVCSPVTDRDTCCTRECSTEPGRCLSDASCACKDGWAKVEVNSGCFQCQEPVKNAPCTSHTCPAGWNPKPDVHSCTGSESEESGLSSSQSGAVFSCGELRSLGWCEKDQSESSVQIFRKNCAATCGDCDPLRCADLTCGDVDTETCCEQQGDAQPCPDESNVVTPFAAPFDKCGSSQTVLLCTDSRYGEQIRQTCPATCNVCGYCGDSNAYATLHKSGFGSPFDTCANILAQGAGTVNQLCNHPAHSQVLEKSCPKLCHECLASGDDLAGKELPMVRDNGSTPR
jgi:hypothetical protein